MHKDYWEEKESELEFEKNKKEHGSHETLDHLKDNDVVENVEALKGKKKSFKKKRRPKEKLSKEGNIDTKIKANHDVDEPILSKRSKHGRKNKKGQRKKYYKENFKPP